MGHLKKLNLRYYAALITLAMTAAPASFAAPVELVSNGGFEDGNVGFSTDFTNAGGAAPGLASVSVFNGTYFGLGANSGSAFLAVNGGNTPGALPSVWEQIVNVVSGVEYTFSFQLGGTSTQPTPVGQLSVQLDGNEILNALAPASATYSSFGTTFIASTTGAFSLSFVEQSVGFGGNDYGLDDISLTFDDQAVSAVPLPAALPLLAGGLGLLGVAGWRRKRKAPAAA